MLASIPFYAVQEKHIKTKLAFSRTNASVLLDLLRGVAAFLVVIGHGRGYLFADYNQVPNHSIWVSGPYLITKAGRQAVIVFFVLSGYLIGGSVLRSVKSGLWNWPSYLTHRLVRLWVVLLPGLLLCAMWDHLALSHHLAPALYRAGADNHMSVNVAARLTPLIFVQNLFFLQVSVADTFGSDSALWSLAYEFWFYLLFPLGLFALARQTQPRKRIVSRSILARHRLVRSCVSHTFSHLAFRSAARRAANPAASGWSASARCAGLYPRIFPLRLERTSALVHG